MALAEVSEDGLHPALQPTTFERRLLAEKPLTYASYQEALQAMGTCTERLLPGDTVTFDQNPLYPYLLYPTVSVTSGAGSRYGPGSRSRIFGPIDRARAKCESEYSAQVEAEWILQNELSGSALIAEQTPFLRCVSAAGAKISTTASLDQIHALFDNLAWSLGLTAAEQHATDACIVKYATFLNSL
ncbi:MAG: hypothetical protein ABSC31_15435 [Acidimicrobiales bacterium]|jgi:hypothetical protein